MDGLELTNLFDEAELKCTRAALEDARHLPGCYYTSQKVYEMEVRKLFLKDWMVVGRVEEFAKPGDYRTLTLVGEPIVIVRDENGQLNAFSNVCLHRGAAVVVGNGNAKEFSCPFHAWLYDLKGQLVTPSRPRGLPKYEYKDCRLPALKLDTWGGFVFVNFDDHSPSLAEYLDVDGFGQAAAFIRPEDFRLVDRYTVQMDCNWKLMCENLVDAYHVEVIHQKTFATEKFGETSLRDLKLTKYGWQKLYPSRSMSPDGEMLFGATPWLKNHPLGAAFAYSAFLRPNFNFLVRADMIQPWVTYPLGPDRCEITAYTCLWTGTEAMPAFKEKVKILGDFARQFIGEDLELLASVQRGLKSRPFRGGPMHSQERAIHHRINRYLDAMQGDGDAL